MKVTYMSGEAYYSFYKDIRKIIITVNEMYFKNNPIKINEFVFDNREGKDMIGNTFHNLEILKYICNNIVRISVALLATGGSGATIIKTSLVGYIKTTNRSIQRFYQDKDIM